MDAAQLAQLPPERIIFIAQNGLIHNCIITALYALILFDSLLLFDAQLRLMFRKKWSWWTSLYLLCRYYPILVWPFYIWAWAQAHENETCNRVLYPLYLLLIPLQAFPQAVIIGRAWAYTKRNRFVLGGLLVPYIAFLGFQFWTTFANLQLSRGELRGLRWGGCFRSYRFTETMVNVRMGCLMAGAIVVDGSATLVIVFHYLKHYRRSQAPITGMRLSTYFVQQGLFYFSLVVALNMVTAAMWFTMGNPYANMWSTVTLVLPNLFACRLILQLEEFHHNQPVRLVRQNLSNIVRDGLTRAEAIEMVVA